LHLLEHRRHGDRATADASLGEEARRPLERCAVLAQDRLSLVAEGNQGAGRLRQLRLEQLEDLRLLRSTRPERGEGTVLVGMEVKHVGGALGAPPRQPLLEAVSLPGRLLRRRAGYGQQQREQTGPGSHAREGSRSPRSRPCEAILAAGGGSEDRASRTVLPGQ